MALYNGDDLRSRVAQQFITLPYPRLTGHVTSPPLSPVSVRRRRAVNTPRVSLRWLASYQTLGALLALYTLVYMWFGLDVVSTSLLLVLACVGYALCAAFVRPNRKLKNT